jgi:hypothetical protein
MILNTAAHVASLLFLSDILVSCAATGWEHPTQGSQRMEEDRTDCMNRATVEHMQIDPHTGAVFDKQGSVKRCLMSKGYIQRSQD